MKIHHKVTLKFQTVQTKNAPIQKKGASRLWARAEDLYVGGFREMTVGKKLWILVLVKLAILFLVFRLFFFPDKLAEEYDNDADRARAVRSALITDTP